MKSFFFFSKAFTSFYHAISNTQNLLKSKFDNSLSWLLNATEEICSKSSSQVIKIVKKQINIHIHNRRF